MKPAFLLLLAFSIPLSAFSVWAQSAQTGTVTYNRTTNALVAPTAAQLRAANDLAPASTTPTLSGGFSAAFTLTGNTALTLPTTGTLLTTSAAAAAYQPLSSNLTSWAAVARAAGVDTFLATPTSANLAALVTNETGTGNLVFSTSPTLVTPVLGVASATSLTISGTAGAGFLSVPAQSSTPAAPASGYVEFADATGQRSWRRASDGFVRSWNSTLTANRTWTMPDATGDVAVVAANGLVARTASGTWAARTLTGTTGQITVTNGDGVSGNPTISLPAALTGLDSLTGGASGLTLNAGGTNQNITLTPSGTGFARVNKKGSGTTDSSLVVGDDLAATTSGGRSKVTFGNTSGGSELLIGQGASNNLVLSWLYNATPASAKANINTYGYSNPLEIDGSVVRLQANTTGNVLIGTTTDVGDRQVVFSSGGAASATRYANGTTGVTSSDGLTVGVDSSGNGLLRSFDGPLTLQGAGAGITTPSAFAVTNSTASSSTTTGALTVGGGVGVAGASFFGDAITNDTTSGGYARWRKSNATSGAQSWSWFADNNGTLFLSAANDNFVGANNFLQFTRSGTTPTALTVAPTTASTSTTTGALVVSGGAGIAGALNTGAEVTIGSTDIRLSRQGAAVLDLRSAAAAGSAIRFDIQGAPSAGLGLRQTGSRDWFVTAQSSELQFDCLTAGSTAAFTSNVNVAVRRTTTSTSTTSGALTVAGGLGVAERTSTSTLNVGGTNGTTVDLIASATATLDFPSISAGGQQDLTITVTGASTGDVVQLGLPAAPTAGVVFNAFVSAANTVTVRASNITGSPIDPASASYRAQVTSF